MKTFLTIFGTIALMANCYASPAGTNSTTSMLPMMLAFAIIAYVILIRPQHKQQKMLSQLISSLKEEDQVKLSSGIIGTIKSIEEQYLNLEIANNVTIKVDKSAVISIIPE